MASAQSQAEQRAAANSNFLANSFKTSKLMNAQNGTTFSVGNQLAFTSPILPGWATDILVFFNLTVSITMGGGAAALNAGAPHNMFSNIALDFSGQNHRNHSGYWLKVKDQIRRAFLDQDAAKTYANNLISNSLPIINGNNAWTGVVRIPMQIEPTDVAGMIPMGESATPITLRLTCAPTFFGADPFNNVVNLTGGATGTVTGTISAVVNYRYGQSVHSPAIKPATPFIGTFAKMVESNTPITSNANYIITELRQPYPHTRVLQAVVVPSAANQFCDPTQVGGLKFDLDPTTVMNDYSAAGSGMVGKLVQQRDLYHADLDPGVFVWDFLAGSMPEVPNGTNTPNIGNYNAAQTEILYNGSLAGSNNRIITVAEFLEPLPY